MKNHNRGNHFGFTSYRLENQRNFHIVHQLIWSQLLVKLATFIYGQSAINQASLFALDTVQDFLIKLGIKPCTYASIGNKNFFIKLCHRQTYQNYEQPPQTLQTLYFQSHFSASKLN